MTPKLSFRRVAASLALIGLFGANPACLVQSQSLDQQLYLTSVARTAAPIGSVTPTPGPTVNPTIAPDPTQTPAPGGLNTAPPASTVRLIFIHHSTGEAWLSDSHGGLGKALRDNNYFVSDTNYGWGPASIGDNTDIGHWYNWFGDGRDTTVLNTLYSESEQHSSYSRLATNPGGENSIILFKSCFPNSALSGSPTSAPPAILSNPLRGQAAGSSEHTVANAKGIYANLLGYFSTQPNKLFILVTAPPLSDGTYSANARALNDWLVNDWLDNYTLKNVAVFDFYTVLTTNGGNADTNDLGETSGNHHRYRNGVIEHTSTGDNDGNPNVLEYPTGDDHPSAAGDQKATAELLPLLNIYYHLWKP